MALKNLSLKLQYRTDVDNMVTEFFIPCLSNSIEYDRAVQYVTLKSISTLSLGLQNFADHDGKIRIITGHRSSTTDLDILGKVFNKKNNTFSSNAINGH